jgi:predicted Co/Zn/Cd cation transporter (cation efflux family)
VDVSMKSASHGCDSKAVESGGHEAWCRNFMWRLIWAIVAGVVAATGCSLVLSWTSRLPRVSDVSLAAAAERSNNPSTWLATFVVAACAAFLLQWFVRSLISLLIRLCRRGPRRTGR